MSDRPGERGLLRLLTILQLAVVSVIILAPLAWMVLSSFRAFSD
jgi:ABC-type glycerol-3-phosphate transport system permease component